MLLGIGNAAEGRAGVDQLFTVREVADRLRVRPVTIYKLCTQGQLAHMRISNAIRISQAAFEALLKAKP